MRTVKVLGLLAAATWLASCGPVESLNPLVTEADCIFDPALLGAWESKDGSDVLKFEAFGYKAYKVTDSNAKTQEQASYEARLGRLDDGLFLDVLPEELKVRLAVYRVRFVSPGDGFAPRIFRLGDAAYLNLRAASLDSQRDLYDLRILPAHWVLQAWKEGSDRLRLGLLDEEWVKKTLDERKVSLAFERVGEDLSGIVLTASTQDLQRFVSDHARDEAAFPDPTEFRRKK